MSTFIEARVIQKIDTEANWMVNPLKLYQGEAAYVSDKNNFKLNQTTTPKTFSELEYYYNGDIIGSVLPTDDLASKLDGVYRATISGTYSGIVVKEGYYTLLRKTGDVWSLESEVKMPTVAVDGSISVGQTTKAVNGDTIFKTYPKEKNSDNLFDFEEITLGKYIDANGGFSDAADWFYSDKIPVLSGKNYVKNECAGAFYDANDVFIVRIATAVEFMKAPNNAAYFRATNPIINLKTVMFQKGEKLTIFEYGNKKISTLILPPSVLARKGNNIIISKNGGGNFRNINDALDWLRDNNEDDAQNPFTFEIIDGIYTESVNLCGRYVSLVGRNRENVIIRTFTNDYSAPPIDMAGNNNLQNLTIIADDDGVSTPPNGVNNMPAYGIHFDIASRYEGLGARVQGRSVVKNCRIISKHQHAVGQGLWTDTFSIWDDCEFIAENVPAFRSHSYMPAGATNQRFLMRNCVAYNNGDQPPIVIQDPNIAGGNDNLDTIYTFQNNIAYNGNGQIQSQLLWTHELIGDGDLSGRIKLGKGSFGNNILRLNK